MKLIVGLGNPGPAHARQRHNIGFMAADAIAARHHIGPLRRRFQGEAAEGRIGDDRVLVLKPQTYMNESGRAVGEAARFYKIDAGDIVVLHDEIDLAAGKVRIKRGGGVAGHNGLKSLAAHVGPDFWRVRIGVGHPGAKHLVHRHVLGDFAKADAAWVDPLLDAIADNADKLVSGDHANFMNELARAARPPEAAAPPAAGSAPQKTARQSASKRPPPAGAPKAPSQRDLARAAAERRKPASRKAKSPAPAEPPATEPPAPDGPFARLRRLLSPARPPDRT